MRLTKGLIAFFSDSGFEFCFRPRADIKTYLVCARLGKNILKYFVIAINMFQSQ